MPSDSRFWSVRFAALRYAAVWLVYAFMRLLVLLPFSWQLRLGKRCGALAGRLMRGRRDIARRNIEICLPELTPSDREALLDRHFEALGASIAETAMGWFGSVQRIERLVRVEGEEHLKAALDKGNGVILFTGHLTSLELPPAVLGSMYPHFCGMFKPQRNPAMNRLMNRGRLRNVKELFAKDNVRGMLKSLKKNAVVWYASDQSYGHKGSALIPFFNEPAMTNTAIWRIAKSSGAAVLPYFYRRLPDDSGYIVDIGPPLDEFPSDDPAHDVARLTRLLEDYIRLCPEQYWWIHQRFKGRPAPYPDVYARSAVQSGG
jgi:Kdo2-lipid IVA lauroyltransferase/acyltransferase